jgi:glycosyltransferase involved in cell wall biosynthesis
MISKILNLNFNAKVVHIKVIDPFMEPVVSVVIPVFNQERIILNHLCAIAKNMYHPFEIIIINDSSYDDTDAEIQKFLNSDSNVGSKCVKTSYFRTRWPWFETRCDDFSIRQAKSDFIIEIQSDMLIKEMYFDKKLKILMETDLELAALSCRGTHGFKPLFVEIAKQNGTDITDRIFQFRLAKKIKFKIIKIVMNIIIANNSQIEENPEQGIPEGKLPEEIDLMTQIFPEKKSNSANHQAGFIGQLIDELPYEGSNKCSQETDRQSMNIWYGETIMRGPLAFSKTEYLSFGGFNIDAFYQGNDDHDLFLRMQKKGRRVGFTPINFASPTQLGNARQKRKIRSKMWSKLHRFARRKGFKESQLYRSSVVA